MPVYFNCDVDSGRPAARVGDRVSCPKHGITSIVSGSPDTFHDDQPAARVGDKTSCDDTLVEGSDSVFINGKPAAFVGCATAHGGKITTGSPTVFMGVTGVGTDFNKNLEQFSMSLDLNTMHESGNHNDLAYNHIAVRITKFDGTYLTTTSTDEHGITHRFYTKEQEEVIAWADFGHWEISEEFEVIELADWEETT